LCQLVPNNVHVVAGEYDNTTAYDAGTGTGTGGGGIGGTGSEFVFPETKVVQVGNFKIGVVHG